MAAIPESTKSSLRQRLEARRRERWPNLTGIETSFRGKFAYVKGVVDSDVEQLPLMRLRYHGSVSSWGFAIFRWSHEGYDDSILPSGAFSGPPEEALDCACGLYLNELEAWLENSPKNL